MKQIFPKEIMDSTVEVHRFKHKVTSKIIYSILLLSIIGTGIALPYVFLDVYSSAHGIIKPKKERNKIMSLFSGKIDVISISQNQFVNKGDTLLVVNNSVGKEQFNLLKSQLEETKSFVEDLTYLSITKKINQKKLQSFQYQKQYIQYLQGLRGLRTSYNKTKRDFVRQGKLYEKGVIAKVEYQNTKYAFDLAESEYNHYIKQQQNQWQADLTQQQNQGKELKSAILQFKEKQKNYIITAPITGTIQNLIGLERGGFITAGSPIADISPETALIAECYVSPSDIGLLKIKNEVKFQIDAFNYNQWEMATGTVIDINKDITIIENRPMFRVVCKISQQYLTLKNGFKGKLKKEMTFNARFFIIRRSAFELLYDKVDDWFNPSTIK